MPRPLDPTKIVVTPGLPPQIPIPAEEADPLRPRFTAVLQTTDTSPHTVDGIKFLIPDNTTVEVSILVEAHGASDSAVFYIHNAYRRSGGGPVALAYTTVPDNDARSAGATSWAIALTTTGNFTTLTVQEPGGTPVKWTVEAQYTIGVA